MATNLRATLNMIALSSEKFNFVSFVRTSSHIFSSSRLFADFYTQRAARVARGFVGGKRASAARLSSSQCLRTIIVGSKLRVTRRSSQQLRAFFRFFGNTKRRFLTRFSSEMLISIFIRRGRRATRLQIATGFNSLTYKLQVSKAGERSCPTRLV